MNIAVNVLGFVAFFFFCLVIMFHIHKAVKYTKWYNRVVSALDEMKVNVKEKWKCCTNTTTEKEDSAIQNNTPYYAQFQESFFQQM